MHCPSRSYACAESGHGRFALVAFEEKRYSSTHQRRPIFYGTFHQVFEASWQTIGPLQIQNGGNIIIVQVENEYGVWGTDTAYMGQVRDAIRASGFDKVQLFRCDWSSNFFKYEVEDIYTALNFGAGSNIDKQFEKYKEIYPKAPLMCSEYWTGWFDYWGRAHETRSISSFIGSLKDMHGSQNFVQFVYGTRRNFLRTMGRSRCATVWSRWSLLTITMRQLMRLDNLRTNSMRFVIC